MYVYNITTKVHLDIAEQWLSWQKEEQVPQMLSLGLFTHANIYQLLYQDESEGITYITQLFFDDLPKYNIYNILHAKRFVDIAILKWGNQFISFNTVMRSVQ